MKKFLLAATVAVLISTVMPVSSMAQGAGAGANKEEALAKLQKISADLQLTPEQKEKMLPILRDEAPKLKAIKGDTSLGPLQKAMKLHQIGTDTDAKVKPILTPAQWDKWEAMRAHEREEMMQKMKNKQ